MGDLHKAIVHVQEHLGDSRFAKLFSLEGPLAAFLSRLYAWCEEVTIDFEAVAVRLRRGEPVLALFARRSVNASFKEFHELSEALREIATPSLGPWSSSSRRAMEDV